MATVSIHMPENTGVTGFTLYLRKTSDGALVNTGGDAMTETPSGSGRFTATVAEAWTETLHATVLDGSSLAVRDGWLADDSTIVQDSYPATVTVSGGGGGSGTGARAVTITVNDGTTALQNATLRLTEGANTFTAQTNVSGVATFNVDDATYTVAITKAGYSYSGTTLAVSASTSVTYSMTAITITPSTGDQTTGYLTTLDETGQAEAGVSIYVSVADVPNDYGLALDEATRTVVSDEDGLVEITGMIKGATYNLRRGTKGRLYPVTIPTTAGSTYELPNMAGT